MKMTPKCSSSTVCLFLSSLISARRAFPFSPLLKTVSPVNYYIFNWWQIIHPLKPLKIHIIDWLTVLLYDDHCDKWWPTMHCIGMHCNEEKKKPVQISPEQLVGLVGEGHFAIRDNCRKHCQNINIWEWNEILSKNHMWYMYHPYFNLERCDSQPPAWWEQPTIAATSWQHLNVNTICASELLTLFVHQNVNTICASEC